MKITYSVFPLDYSERCSTPTVGKLLAFSVMFVAIPVAQATSIGFLYTAGSFAAINVPGATLTWPRGINDAGQIVGSFNDANGRIHGFLYSGGSFTIIDVPGAPNTFAYDINSAGQIVGSSNAGPASDHGFIYTQGSLTTVDVPGSVVSRVRGVNDAGQIVGDYLSPTNPGVHSFLGAAGSFANIDVSGATNTDAFDINNAGQIVGSTDVSPGYFLYTGGSFSVINVPGPPHGINDAGQIVGSFYTGGSWHGFLYTGNSFNTIDMPGASDTYLYRINNAGQMIGMAVGNSFEETSEIPEPGSIALLCSGLAVMCLVAWRKRQGSQERLLHVFKH